MRVGYREACLEHETGPRHPDSPDRLRAIRRALATEHDVEYVAAEPAAPAELRWVHDAAYVDAVESFCAAGGGTWEVDTVGVEGTWDAALAAAGLARWAALAALEGADGRATPFAIGRPPGHHAEPGDAMGFCFFNNVAVAAEAALRAGADRVAIFDWDVHHGNGTQVAFLDRGDVCYVSVHERGLYPGTGAVEEIGTGAGEGATVNVPLPGGSGDAAYAAAIEEVLDPVLGAFDPDLLLVSAGFDAHERDVISRMRVSTEGYGHLSTHVRSLCDRLGAGLAFVLEGGYDLTALSDSIRTVNETFGGREPLSPDGPPGSDARAVIDQVRAAHGLGSK